MLSYAAILRASLELVSTPERVHYLSVLSRHDHQCADGLGLHLITNAYHNALCGLIQTYRNQSLCGPHPGLVLRVP